MIGVRKQDEPCLWRRLFQALCIGSLHLNIPFALQNKHGLAPFRDEPRRVERKRADEKTLHRGVEQRQKRWMHHGHIDMPPGFERVDCGKRLAEDGRVCGIDFN